MSSTKNPGRFAGLLYILMSIPGFFAMGYVPSKLIVHGNAAATASNISASVWLALDGFAWVILSLTGVLLPQYYDKVFTYTQPAVLGEIAFMLWLVIKGARPPALATVLSSAAG